MWWQDIYVPPRGAAPASGSARTSECEAETESDPEPEPRAIEQGAGEAVEATQVDVREEEEAKSLKTSLENFFKLYNPAKLKNVDKLVVI